MKFRMFDLDDNVPAMQGIAMLALARDHGGEIDAAGEHVNGDGSNMLYVKLRKKDGTSTAEVIVCDRGTELQPVYVNIDGRGWMEVGGLYPFANITVEFEPPKKEYDLA